MIADQVVAAAPSSMISKLCSILAVFSNMAVAEQYFSAERFTARSTLVGFYLLLFIGAWAVVSGIFEIIGAVRLRKEIDNEWMLILHGVVTVLFGIMLMAWPVTSALALIWVIGAYAIAAGVIMIALAFRLKGHAGRAA